MCLVRFALANVRRRPERFVLSVFGIALAIACVTVVRTIRRVLPSPGPIRSPTYLTGPSCGQSPPPAWQYDANARRLVANGPAPVFAVPGGWTVTRTLSGVTQIGGLSVSLRGHRRNPGGEAFGLGLAKRLGLERGRSCRGGQPEPRRRESGSRHSITVASAGASIVGSKGWWTIFAPAGEEKRRDLARSSAVAVGLRPPPTVGRSRRRRSRADLRHSRWFRAADLRAEILGVVLRQGDQFDARPDLDHRARPGIRHRRVIVPRRGGERRREFGIMSSIGLADEVLYFFLVESAVVFVAAYLVGVLGAGAAVALVIPGIATPTAWRRPRAWWSRSAGDGDRRCTRSGAPVATAAARRTAGDR